MATIEILGELSSDAYGNDPIFQLAEEEAHFQELNASAYNGAELPGVTVVWTDGSSSPITDVASTPYGDVIDYETAKVFSIHSPSGKIISQTGDGLYSLANGSRHITHHDNSAA